MVAGSMIRQPSGQTASGGRIRLRPEPWPPSTSRQHHHTAAAGRYNLADTATVTLVVHPLVGSVLPVVRGVRCSDGRRYLDLQHPAGHVFRLPIEYTDQATPSVPTALPFGEVRVSVAGLLKLVSAVAAAQSTGQKLDEDGCQGGTGRRSAEQTPRSSATPSSGEHSAGHPHADDVAGGKRRDLGRGGDVGPQVVVPTSSEKGGCR